MEYAPFVFLSVFLVFLQKWDIEISSKWSCVVLCGHKVNKSSCVKKKSKRWLEKPAWLKCSKIWFSACWSHPDMSCSSCPWVGGAPQPGHVGQPSTLTPQVLSQRFASPQMLVGGNRSTTHTNTCTTCTVNKSKDLIRTSTFAMKLLSRGGPSNTRAWKCPGGDFVLVPLVEGCLSGGLYPAEAETLPRVPHSNGDALANAKESTGRRFNDLQAQMFKKWWDGETLAAVDFFNFLLQILDED